METIDAMIRASGISPGMWGYLISTVILAWWNSRKGK